MKTEFVALKNSPESEFLASLNLATKEIQGRSYRTDSEGPRGMYTYMSLPGILENIVPVLHKHGIALNSIVTYDNELVNVKLMFSNDKVMVSESMVFPPQLSPTEIMEHTRKDKNGTRNPTAVIHYTGSMRTYFTRYALLSFFCIHPDEDSDGYNLYHSFKDEEELQKKPIFDKPQKISEPVEEKKVEKPVPKPVKKKPAPKPVQKKVEKPKSEYAGKSVDYLKAKIWEKMQAENVSVSDAKQVLNDVCAKYGLKNRGIEQDFILILSKVRKGDFAEMIPAEDSVDEHFNAPKEEERPKATSFLSRATEKRRENVADSLGETVGYSDDEDEVDEESSFSSNGNDLGEFEELFDDDDSEGF